VAHALLRAVLALMPTHKSVRHGGPPNPAGAYSQSGSGRLEASIAKNLRDPTSYSNYGVLPRAASVSKTRKNIACAA